MQRTARDARERGWRKADLARERGWRKADLARAMGLGPRQIDRLLDLRHQSTVAQLEQALAVCGKRAEIGVTALAA